MVETTERRPTEQTAVDPGQQALFMPRPEEPVTAYAERLRLLRANLDRLIATVERGVVARENEQSAALAGPAAPRPLATATAPAAPRPLDLGRSTAPATPARVEIITVAPERAERIAEDERRWAAERRQRLTERRIAPERRVGRADTRSHTFERRGPDADRRGGSGERRVGPRRAPVITEPRPVLDPITWVWVFQIVLWVGIAVAALALT